MTNPEPVVGALIINDSGEILLVKQTKWNDKFCIPGGHVEFNETLETALKREIQEEVGLSVEVVELLGVQDSINAEKNSHFIFLDYICRTAEKEVKLDNDECQEYVWIDPVEALNLNLHDSSKLSIKRFLSNTYV